jgi:hypothetical protein
MGDCEMIKGTKCWDDRKTFSIQTNNSVENLLRLWSGKEKGFLESCGPTAAINVLESMGHPVAIMSPAMAMIQPEDFLTIWMNDPKNTTGFDATAPVNEYPRAYPNAITKAFGRTCRYLEGQSFEWISSMVSSGTGAMICMRNPGHFLAVVAFDNLTNELIYRDPWPNRTNTDGFNLRMGKKEFDTNVKPYVVVFG